MPKTPLNEGIVERLLTAIFMSVAKEKGEVLKQKFDNDPKIQFHLKQLETSRDALEKYIESRRKKDPNVAKMEKEIERLTAVFRKHQSP